METADKLWLTAAAMNIEKALKQLQKTGSGDNNFPGVLSQA